MNTLVTYTVAGALLGALFVGTVLILPHVLPPEFIAGWVQFWDAGRGRTSLWIWGYVAGVVTLVMGARIITDALIAVLHWTRTP